MEPRQISQACALLLILCLSLACYSQSPPQTPTLTTTADLVIVPVLVRQSSGDLVRTLHASEFLLNDNGVPQTVTLEETEHQPLSIVVLMQTGASAPRQFPDYAKLGIMLTYLTANSPYQIAMVTFDSRPEYIWDFASDIAGLEDGFAKPDPGDRKAAILDAVSYGIDLLRKQPPKRRRIILLLSQTHDEGSLAHAEDIIKRLGESNITIDCLTFSPEKAWLKDQFTQPRHENPLYQLSPNLPLLQHTFNLDKPLGVALSSLRENTSSTIALLSGGESFLFATKSELEQDLSMLTNHFGATSTLSFRPTSKQPGFHSLQIHIAGRPDLQISARTSYWASDK
jgi:VWFA-related protein